MALDLGKQIGPLPLGAWVIVVGAGLGIALWTRREQQAPEVVESGNTESGVGVGGSGMYTQLVPVQQPTGATKPTTNEEWGVQAINWLIAHNYPADVSDQAVRKYLAGNKLSVGEYTLIGLVLKSLGAPPQVLPPTPDDPAEPPPTEPPPTTPPPTTPPATDTRRYFTVTVPKNVKQIAAQVYGSSEWNGPAGRLYWANEWIIVQSARSNVAWWASVGFDHNHYADYPLPTGTRLVLP